MLLNDSGCRRRDRAVSNTVAFILVFSLIVLSVGLVSTAGFDTLRDLQRDEQARTAGALVRTVGAGIDEVALGERPTYRNSLQLGEATLTVENETRVDVVVSNTTGPVFDETYHPNALVYRTPAGNTSYVSGVLARGAERRSAVALDGPTAQCSTGADTAAITLVSLNATEGGAVGGGPVTIDVRSASETARGNISQLRFPNTTPSPVNPTGVEVTVDGPWADAWQDSLVEQGFTDTGGGTYECSVGQVFVRVVRIRIGLLV